MTAPLTIYVAGGSNDRALVASYLAELRAVGWTITYDWTSDPGWDDPAHPRIESARADVRGIFAARVFWYVAPATKSEGSHFELGVAWWVREVRIGDPSNERTIIASGPTTALGRVFPTLADRAYETHTEALAWLMEQARRWPEAVIAHG